MGEGGPRDSVGNGVRGPAFGHCRRVVDDRQAGLCDREGDAGGPLDLGSRGVTVIDSEQFLDGVGIRVGQRQEPLSEPPEVVADPGQFGLPVGVTLLDATSVRN